MGDAFSPFNDDGSNIVMPGGLNIKDAKITKEDIEEIVGNQENLISEGVEEAIKGTTVKSMILKEDDSIELPNFTLDISLVESMSQLQMEALDSLLHPDGNTAIYILSDKVGLVKLGMGLNGMLNKILPRVVYNVIGEECKIYGNFETGKPAKIISDSNIITKRMNI